MKSLFMSGLLAMSLMMSACAHHRCHCQKHCKDGECKMEMKKDGKGGCEDCMKHNEKETKPATEEKKP